MGLRARTWTGVLVLPRIIVVACRAGQTASAARLLAVQVVAEHIVGIAAVEVGKTAAHR